MQKISKTRCLDCKTEYLFSHYISKQGYKYQVIEYFSYANCTIMFEDGCKLTDVPIQNIRRQNVRNPMHKTIEGRGFVGNSSFKYRLDRKVYNIWRAMFQRCYKEKDRYKNPSYKDTTISEVWWNFQVFKKWYDNSYKKDFYLDKDILIKGNKVYSPETCCFVPVEINNVILKSEKGRGGLPIGVTKVDNNKYAAHMKIGGKQTYLGRFDTIEGAFECYKLHKELRIKEMANKWRDSITEQVYRALTNYKIEIDD